MNSEKLILESEKKSFLREKWEKVLKKIIIKRIPKEYLENDQIIFLNSENEIKNYLYKNDTNLKNKKKNINNINTFN